MKEYTQSNLDPGNCWQTAVACILEVDPSYLPPQHLLEIEDNNVRGEVFEGNGHYINLLNTYLEKHHGLMYYEVQEYMLDGLLPKNDHHVCIGPTVRTKKEGSPVYHAVVGFKGRVTWDVHPSRDGLTKIEKWGIISTIPDVVKARLRPLDGLAGECLCPRCSLPKFRMRLQEAKDKHRHKPSIETEMKLRQMLAFSYCKGTLYTDDGELQDNSAHPFIDFKRDKVEEIEKKMMERTADQLKALKAEENKDGR